MEEERSPARKVATQHQLIESLLKGLRSAVEARDRDRSESRLTGLRRALEAHFVLEEEHYFAAARESHPELEPDLDRLGAEHREMLSRVESLVHDLRDLAWDDAGPASASLERFFHRHEEVERKLMAG